AELAGVAVEDRPGPDDQDAPEVGPLGQLFLHESVDYRGFRRGLFSAVEDIVEPAVADPCHLTAAPELLAEHAHPPIDALADRVGFERGLALRGERRPLGFLAAPFS